MEYGRKDNPAFEYAKATVAAEEPGEDSRGVLSQAAWMTRCALRAVAEAAAGDPVALAMAIQRASGMTLAEIGASRGVSKQAVHKRLAAVCRASPAVEAFLGMDCALDESMAGDQDLLETLTEHEARRREMTRWMKRSN